MVVPSPATSLVLRANFPDHLAAHVLEAARQIDLFGNGHAVLRDHWRSELAFEDHVAAFRAEGYIHRIRQNIDSPENLRSGLRHETVSSLAGILNSYGFPRIEE